MIFALSKLTHLIDEPPQKKRTFLDNKNKIHGPAALLFNRHRILVLIHLFFPIADAFAFDVVADFFEMFDDFAAVLVVADFEQHFDADRAERR